MTNKFDEMRWAVAEAEVTLNAADSVTTDMARLLLGRLERVNNGYLLANLKRELRRFNIRTHTWEK